MIDNKEKDNVLELMINNKENQDNSYLITIKNLIGSERMKQLKYHTKRALKMAYKKGNHFVKFDSISTIQSDTDNYTNNNFLISEFKFHSHTLVITPLSKKELEYGIEKYHNSLSKSKIDITIQKISESDIDPTYNYIKREVSSLGKETKFTRITNKDTLNEVKFRNLPQESSAEVGILPDCLT